MTIPNDILRKVESVFESEKLPEISNRLESYIEEFKSESSQPELVYRIIRCILKLVDKDTELFTYYIKESMIDYRDIIHWAEYDKNDKKVFSGDQPFS